MKYMGSKRRFTKYIMPYILGGRKCDQVYVEPFVGGCNSIEYVKGPRIGADLNGNLIQMWQALQTGWRPPKLISETEYQHYKHCDCVDIPLKTYVGYALSFAAKYYERYRRDRKGQKGEPQNQITQSIRAYNAMMDQIPKIMGIEFVHSSYDSLSIPPKSIIYCDPPYRGVLGYGMYFDHDKFDQWCQDRADEGHSVFVSEYNAPEHWEVLWQRGVTVTLSQQHSKETTEKLYQVPSDSHPIPIRDMFRAVEKISKK